MRMTMELRDGLEVIAVDAEHWRFVVVPAVGGKLVSLVSRAAGREWLWRQPGRPLQPVVYGGAFDDYDMSGFDECFPGIGAGNYPHVPWQDRQVPDHGELWCQAWEYDLSAATLRMGVNGVRFPYRFERMIEEGTNGALVFRYHVQNLADEPLSYLWAVHPLFAVQPGTRIVLPQVREVVVDSSKHGRLGGLLDAHPWPHTQDQGGRTIDLSLVEGPECGTADKLYALGLSEGWCALHDPASGTYLALTFDLVSVPFLGIWINQGGWPFERQPSFNVALEPCKGYPDRLDVAAVHGQCAVLPPRGTADWSFQIYSGIASHLESVRPDGRVV